MQTAPRIFIVGSERSGSNLLRSLLGNHSAIEAPVDPHYFDAWYGALRFYGDLRDESNMRHLLADMLEYANHPFNDWGLETTAEELLAKHGPRCFLDAFDALYLEQAARHAKTGYLCKGNHIFNYAFQVKAHWPDAKLLYLYRDPRDHCASWKEKPLHLKTVFDAVVKWEREQRRCLQLVKSHGIDMHFVSYEELIADTPQVMARVLTYCGLPVEEACFETDSAKQRSTAQRYVYWQNLDKPIIRDNKRKYLKTLKQEEVRLIETVAREMMQALGYAPDTDAGWKARRLHGLRLRLERRRTEVAHREHLAKDLSLLHQKNDLLKRIQERARARKLK